MDQTASTSTTAEPCPATTTTTTGSTTTTTRDSGSLPKTGADIGGLALLGLALVVSGGAVVLTVHRGRRAAG